MEKKIEQIKNIFHKNETILLAFIFGSYATGHATPESDFDIAIFFKEVPDFFTIDKIKDKISAVVHKNVDIVTLNNASPIIKMQVLKKGIPILKKDPKAYNSFFVSTVIEYDDLKRTRESIEKNILRGTIYA